MIELLTPWALLFLPLPWLVYRFCSPAKRQERALKVPFLQTFSDLNTEQTISAKRHLWKYILLIITWLALVLAAARPQWVGDPIKLPTTGRDLMIAVDISGSMSTDDLKLNNRTATRLAVVKSVVSEFIKRRQGDRLGLILFGTNAYLQAPLTFDRNTVETLLNEAPIGIAGGKTAIGDAIGLSVKRLRKRPVNSRVLILITDGVSNVGEVEPIQAAKLAAQEEVTVYTVGVGSDEMVLPGIFGTNFGSRRVNPSADLDEDTLKEVANLTQGRYFRAKDTQQLADIYRLLDQLEPIEQEAETYRPIKALFYWPLGVALLMSFLLALINLPWQKMLMKQNQYNLKTNESSST